MKYANFDEIEAGMRKKYDAISAIYNALKEKRSHTDNSNLMKEIHDIINEYIRVETDKPSIIIDISTIDFKRLAAEFEGSKRQNLFMFDIQEAVKAKLEKLLAANPQRIDYYTRYQAIISGYNREQDRATIEKAFEELLKLAVRVSMNTYTPDMAKQHDGKKKYMSVLFSYQYQALIVIHRKALAAVLSNQIVVLNPESSPVLNIYSRLNRNDITGL